jgi:uncharacterized membrane protein YqjE
VVNANTGTTEPTPGLLVSLRRLLKTFTEILHTRVDILSTELEEEVCRVQQLLVYGLVSVFFLGLGLVLVTLFVVMAFWETNRLYVLACLAVSYLGVGAITALVVRHKVRTRPRLFSTTLSELDKDRQSLGSRP